MLWDCELLCPDSWWHVIHDDTPVLSFMISSSLCSSLHFLDYAPSLSFSFYVCTVGYSIFQRYLCACRCNWLLMCIMPCVVELNCVWWRQLFNSVMSYKHIYVQWGHIYHGWVMFQRQCINPKSHVVSITLADFLSHVETTCYCIYVHMAHMCVL
jgi:hypothetical protein